MTALRAMVGEFRAGRRLCLLGALLVGIVGVGAALAVWDRREVVDANLGIVLVTAGEEAVRNEWCRAALLIALGALCMAAGAFGVFGASAARSRGLERHNAELAELAAALRRSEARFRDFALTSSDWFWESDENQRFTYQSDEIRRFGQDPRDRIGLTRIQLAADAASEPEKWREHLAILERHEPFRNFVYARSVGGEPVRMISVSGTPRFDADSRFMGYRGTARDVTAECLAERQLCEAKAAAEAANHAKTQFLANVSHELRTPLNAILGFSEMLELGIVGKLKRKQVEYIQLIRHSGNHLHEVINDILDFAKVDAGKLDLHEEEGIDPRHVVDGCFAIVKERAKLGRLKLTASFAESLPLLVVDETRLKQILLNLLSNAIKFTEEGGSVVVEIAATAAGGIAFAVRDTGIGMAPQELAIALEPFGQVDGGLARRHEGSGLGLPLARRLAELHGGALSIDSAKGSGTTVTLVLPPTRTMAEPAAAPAPEPAAA